MKASKKQRAAAVVRVREWRKTHQWSLKEQWKRGNARRAKNRRPQGVEVELEINEDEAGRVTGNEVADPGDGVGVQAAEGAGGSVPVFMDGGAGAMECGEGTGEEQRVLEWIKAKQAERAQPRRRGVEVELVI